MAKSSPPAIGSGGSVSEDLISDILLRLPVKLILRCKAVSKSWKTLISSPHFIKSHLLRTIASSAAAAADDDETVIVHSYDDYDVSVCSVLLLNVNSAEIVADLNLPYFKDEFPLDSNTCLVGSACGIVCFCVCGSFDDLGIRRSCITECPIEYTYLWNPATRQSIRIPQHTIDVESTHWLIGFGFDHVSNDFKVLRIVVSTFSAEVYSAEVYSTNRNCWRMVEQVANYSVGSYMSSDIFVCVKGYLCCARITHMVAFDLNMEVLNSAIGLPVISQNARITDFNDSIAVVNMANMDINCNIELWKLEDETCLLVGGVEASWTLMLDIDLTLEVEHVHGYLNNGYFLISLDEDSWFLFNSGTNVVRYLPSYFYPGQIFKYTESLVTFPGFKLVDWSGGEVEMEVKDEGIDTYEDETETQGEVEDDIRNSC